MFHFLYSCHFAGVYEANKLSWISLPVKSEIIVFFAKFGWSKLRLITCSTNIKKQSFADVFQNRCSQKFLNIHRKTPVLEFFKKRLQHRCFPVNIAKFLRTVFLMEHLRWQLLNILLVTEMIFLEYFFNACSSIQFSEKSLSHTLK